MSDSYHSAPSSCPLESLSYLEQNNLLYSSIPITTLLKVIKKVSCQLACSDNPSATPQTLISTIMNAIDTLNQSIRLIYPKDVTITTSQKPISTSTTNSITKSITHSTSDLNKRSTTSSITTSTTKTVTYSNSHSNCGETSHSITHSTSQITPVQSDVNSTLHSITHSVSHVTKEASSPSKSSTICHCSHLTEEEISKIINDLHSIIYAFITVSDSMSQSMSHELNTLSKNINQLSHLTTTITREQYESDLETLKKSLQNLYNYTNQTSQSLLNINKNQIQQLADDVTNLISENS